MTDNQQPTSGVIEHVEVLDLSAIRSVEEFRKITAIHHVEVVVVPESLASELAGIEVAHVEAIVPVPDGATVSSHVGMVTMGGDALAEPAGDNAVLVVVGGLVLTTPVTRVGYRRIAVVGVVLAPHGSQDALGGGITHLVGMIDYYPYADGQQVRVHAGNVELSGAALANPGGTPNDVLLVAGEIFVTSPVTELGYRSIVGAGEMIAPRESEPILSGALKMLGQTVWYSGLPRIFQEHQRFSKAFFELLPEPTALALLGGGELDDDVTIEVLREKITGITLAGALTAPKALVPLLQVLVTDNYGHIGASDE